MRPTFQAPRCDAGFTLIEVLVAVALVAVMVAAITSSILTANKIESAAAFSRDAALVAETLQATAYGLASDEARDANRDVLVAVESITAGDAADGNSWSLYRLTSPNGKRAVRLAVKDAAR